MLNKNKSTKPPLGLKPRFIHDEQRLGEVKTAIIRYYESSKKLPLEWIEEYNELIDSVEKHKLTKKE